MTNQPDQPAHTPDQPPYAPSGSEPVQQGWAAPAGPGGQFPQQTYPQPPYGQVPYAQNQYGQNQYGQNAHVPNPYAEPASGPTGLSLSSMVIGIVSLVFLGWLMVPQIVGIVLGHIGLHKESPQGRGYAIAGLITGYLALAIYAGIYLVGLLFLGLLGSNFSEHEVTYASIR